MKFSTACVVLAAVATAAPARASVIKYIAETFSPIKSQALIKEAEAKNNRYLWPALTHLAYELHQDLNSDTFKMGDVIRNNLVDVNIKIGNITGNVNAILPPLELVASSSGTCSHCNARRDFDMNINSVKQFFEKTFNMTNVAVGLIDETKEMLGNGVRVPLKTLQLTVQIASEDKITREYANIRRQQLTIDNPPKWFFSFPDHQAVAAAQVMKDESKITVQRIKLLAANILDHVTWLEGLCQDIREELDNERTAISTLYDNIRECKSNFDLIVENFVSSKNLSDEDYREGSSSLLQLMIQLRDKVRHVTSARSRRAAEQKDNMETNESFSGDFLQPSNRPSWLDKTADNGCFYIYNNRTAGCISVETFDAMKKQYTSLSDKFLEFDGLFRNYDKELKNVATQVIDRSKNTTNQMDAIKFASDLETKKVLLSDDIKKIRDLSANLNAYAESLFSEANAQLFINRNKDQRLNNDITRFVDEMEKVAMVILSKNIDDILGINRQVADILSRVKINVACVEQQKYVHNAYNRF